jgi:glycosyltransferase involved in cell wall biosynthesis
VAISRHQASSHPEVPWTVVHNGLTLAGMPFRRERTDAFVFVGRVDPEKGVVEAIEIAKKAGRPLRIAAKVGTLPAQRQYHDEVFMPAVRRAGSSVEFLGELRPQERDQLFAESYATLMPGAWPEPFGLVAIESLATGTPIVARRIGALPEIMREGVDGVFGDDVTHLAFLSERVGAMDREAIRERVIERFSAERMTDRYEELYARMVGREVVAGRIETKPAIPAIQVATEVAAASRRGAEAPVASRGAAPTVARPLRAVGPGATPSRTPAGTSSIGVLDRSQRNSA